MSETSGKPPLSVDFGVKAEASVGLKAEVPSSSMGRLVDALTDTFRPFSEARGLKGDQIRLQRAEVAIQMAELAKRQLAIESAEIAPVPAKVLIPLIEKASLEDLGSEMVQRWANLLASAATNTGIHPRLVQVLSEMEGRQIALLEKIALNGHESVGYPLTALGDSVVELGVVQFGYVLEEVVGDEDLSPSWPAP